MSVVQPVWATAPNLAPEEVVHGNFRTIGAVTRPDLRRAMAPLTGITNLERLGSSFFGGRCYVTLRVAALQRFIWSVCWGVLDVLVDVAETEIVTVRVDFDEFSPAAFSTQEHKTCSTS